MPPSATVVPGPFMVPSVQVNSPLTSTVSDPVKTPTSPPVIMFRLATVIVAPVLKFTAPDSIVRLPSDPTVLPGAKTTLEPAAPSVLIRVSPLGLYVLPAAKLADTPDPNVT